jgi:hypothetical protein
MDAVTLDRGKSAVEHPTSDLAFGDPNNVADWKVAWEGQWFIGVMDIVHRKVHVLPINPRTPDALKNTGNRNRNRYASGPESKNLPAPKWKSCPPEWDTKAVGHTTHHRCLNYYKLQEADCLGFTMIKLDYEGKFALVKLTSNSLNMKDQTGKPGHSFSRATDRASERDEPYAPGTAKFLPGTHCMGEGWARALEGFLHAQGIEHTALSMD